MQRLNDHYTQWHDKRHEKHVFTVAGRTFGLVIDHGHAEGCGLPTVPASIVWWEDVGAEGELRVKDRAYLMMETVW